MAEREDNIAKLRYIPKFELVALLNRKFAGRYDKLKSLIKDFDGVNTKNPVAKLSKFNHSNVIDFFKLIDPLPEKDIDELFKEYAYTKNPGLVFCGISTFTSKKFDEYSEKKINELLEEGITLLNEKISDTKDPDFRNIKVIEVKKSYGIVEANFEYESRIDYISPQNRSIKSVYNLETCNIWISTSNKAIIFNLSNNSILSPIIDILESVISAYIIKYNIPKEIGDKIFGFDTIKKANFTEPDSTHPDYDERKSVSDNNFSQKKESRILNDRCDRTSALHRIEFQDKKISITVMDSGRIIVHAHIKKSDLRAWAFEVISKISEYISQLTSKDYRKTLKSIDVSSLKSLKNIRTIKGKEAFSQIFVGISKILEDNSTSTQLNINAKEISMGLSEYLVTLFQPTCNSCAGLNYTHECGAINSVYVDGFTRLKCSDCDKLIDSPTKEIKCLEDGRHAFLDSILDILVLISTPKLIATINDFSKEIGSSINLNLSDVIRIKGRSLSIKQNLEKKIYLMDEIDAFAKIPSLKNISQNFRDLQLENLKYSSEKCDEYSDSNCKNCMIKQKGLCMQRLVAEFVQNPSMHAHHGLEYGDMRFNITIQNKNVMFIGVAKSCKGDINKTLTMKNNEGIKLIMQLMDLFADIKINGVCVISSAIIEERLSETIKALAIYYNKILLFIERPETIRLLEVYLKTRSSLTPSNYWKF